MKKKIMITLASVVLGVLVLFMAAGSYFYSESVKRGVEVELYDGEAPVEPLASEQDQSIISAANEWFDEQQLETIELSSYDGLTLKASLLENEEPSGKAVILAHGYRGIGLDMQELVKFYYDQGFDVLMPDARGHGQSEGDYIDYGWHSRLDYKAWIEKLVDNHGAESVFLHGNSMGAALVLMASGEQLPLEVKGIIADSAYTTAKEELTHQLKYLYNLPAFPLLEVTSVITKIRAGYSFEEASAIKQVRKANVPVFLIHGDADELVPTEMAYKLYEAIETEKKLWIVPEAGHTDAYTMATSEFQTKLKTFIEESLTEND